MMDTTRPSLCAMFFQLNCADLISVSVTDDTSQSNDAEVEADDSSNAGAQQGSECDGFRGLSDLVGFEACCSAAMDGNSGVA